LSLHTCRESMSMSEKNRYQILTWNNCIMFSIMNFKHLFCMYIFLHKILVKKLYLKNKLFAVIINYNRGSLL